ncbi:GNAT family N-acetyltransferase [Arthrobacter oryzae]|uniref:GNAT family N-acetyltransferase n=1 Tax=Arthrobacter oryzae TaxID=409290 RepID=UPI0028567537|nr:GNAT family N-acetyltransferase [Arthrobacter oryzae]MDR6506147.1 RimJ/RimL family protein N-acetyltransferase [Arthrobacter oryzae]
MQPLPSIVTEPILTERLELRPLAASDAAALRGFRGNPAAVRYLSHQPLSAGQSDRLLTDLLTRAERSTSDWFHVGWAVVVRSSGAVIGDGRTWNTAEPPLPGTFPDRHASLGYLLHPDHHGKGYGSETAAALVRWLFTERGICTIYAGVYEANTASRRLLEGLGFVRDHYFTANQDSHGKGLASWRYRLDRAAWSGRPPYGHNSTPHGSRR